MKAVVKMRNALPILSICHFFQTIPKSSLAAGGPGALSHYLFTLRKIGFRLYGGGFSFVFHLAASFDMYGVDLKSINLDE